MKLNLLFSFMCITLALQAGEKRSYAKDEPEHKVVKLTSTEIQTDPMDLYSTSEEAAAPAPSTSDHEETSAIKRTILFALHSFMEKATAQHLSQCEQLIQQHRWIIEDKRCMYTVIEKLLSDENIPLLSLLTRNGLDLSLYGDLLEKWSPFLRSRMVEFMLAHGARLTINGISSIMSSGHGWSYIDDIMQNHADKIVFSHHSCDKETLIGIVENLIIGKKPHLLRLFLARGTHVVINEKTNKQNYLILEASKFAAESRNQPTRIAALEVVRLLLAYGADPRLASGGVNAFMLAQQKNDRELLNMLNSYALQSLRL